MDLPSEILQHIYAYLSPPGFESARRVSRAWFRASLSRGLLATMLKRGGWWSSVQHLQDVNLGRCGRSMRKPDDEMGEIRLWSKWITRETLLANTDPRISAFEHIGDVDFSRLASEECSQSGLNKMLDFTTSLCGRFVTARRGRMLYVYELHHDCQRKAASWKLRPRGHPLIDRPLVRLLTSLECPGTIIDCSMNASAERFAIAVLMAGRLGMCCDLPGLAYTRRASGASGCSCEVATPRITPLRRELSRSMYRNTCHPDDPPRCVAICGHRDAVAFGCSSGIELH